MDKKKIYTLVGKNFGLLKVIKLHSSSTEISRGRIWECICKCGNTCFVDTGKLNSGNTKSCGCIKNPNLIGKKFGLLTIIKDVGVRKNNTEWLCKCDCGGSKTVSTTQLNAKKVRSCGCLRSGGLNNGIKSLPKGIAVMNTIISRYKNNAKLNNRDFKLTKDQCEKLFLDNCFYCGAIPIRTYTNKRTGDSFTYNGIDRLDNSIGYLDNNCVSSCTICNIRKGSDSSIDFINWAKKIAINHNNK